MLKAFRFPVPQLTFGCVIRGVVIVLIPQFDVLHSTVLLMFPEDRRPRPRPSCLPRSIRGICWCLVKNKIIKTWGESLLGPPGIGAFGRYERNKKLLPAPSNRCFLVTTGAQKPPVRVSKQPGQEGPGSSVFHDLASTDVWNSRGSAAFA